MLWCQTDNTASAELNIPRAEAVMEAVCNGTKTEHLLVYISNWRNVLNRITQLSNIRLESIIKVSKHQLKNCSCKERRRSV